jgi:hypothetical protein
MKRELQAQIRLYVRDEEGAMPPYYAHFLEKAWNEVAFTLDRVAAPGVGLTYECRGTICDPRFNTLN